MYSHHQCVLKVMQTLKPFSEDGGESGRALQAFDLEDWKVVHYILESWVKARPCVGGQLYGYEVVRLPCDSCLKIIAPDGNVYSNIMN